MDTKQIYMNDGRRAEERSYVNDEGNKVTELWTEEPNPLKLAEKVTEKSAQVIVERVIDKVDLVSGEVLERKVESIEPNVKLELREHLGVERQNISNYATKEELVNVVAQAVADTIGNRSIQAQSVSQQPKLSVMSVVKDRVEQQKSSENMWNLGLIGIIVIGIGYVAYQYIM